MRNEMAAWQTDAWSAGTGRGEPFSSTTSRPVSACANTVAPTGRNRARPEGPGAIRAVVSTPVTQRPHAEGWARVKGPADPLRHDGEDPYCADSFRGALARKRIWLRACSTVATGAPTGQTASRRWGVFRVFIPPAMSASPATTTPR
ncbi:hypothetical protein KPP03845_106088 [Streptomyces xanthophaeus]|nr:hypothetical protein KPP03845_106088 [Streptomyces xanthophaeus]